jgi:hypothetical protein
MDLSLVKYHNKCHDKGIKKCFGFIKKMPDTTKSREGSQEAF